MDAVIGAQAPLGDAHVGDDPLVGIVMRVENQGAQEGIVITFGRRDLADHRLE